MFAANNPPDAEASLPRICRDGNIGVTRMYPSFFFLFSLGILPIMSPDFASYVSWFCHLSYAIHMPYCVWRPCPRDCSGLQGSVVVACRKINGDTRPNSAGALLQQQYQVGRNWWPPSSGGKALAATAAFAIFYVWQGFSGHHLQLKCSFWSFSFWW